MEIKNLLRQAIGEVLDDSLTVYDEIQVSVPEDLSHGDYTTNIALTAYRIAAKAFHGHVPGGKKEGLTINRGNSPYEWAVNFKESLLQKKLPFIQKIEVAGPGFLNFWIIPQYLLEHAEKRVKDELNLQALQGKTILVEFTDPNPFKEFHIGHLYSNTIGEALCRLLEAQGAKVIRICYQGDVGLHVAKALWGMEKKIREGGLTIHTLEEKSLEERAKFLGEAYTLGSVAYEESKQVQEEVKELNKKVFIQDFSIIDLYSKGKEWSLAYFDQLYQRLGVHFDKFYFESEVGSFGKALVEEYLQKGVFVQSEGAVIFPGEKYGLHSRVFINSLGLPTYEAKELGLAHKKAADFPEADISLIITGNEINDYFQVLKAALDQISPDIAAKTTHLSHGMVRLPEGKMSSRTGKVITAEQLLDEATEKEQELIEEVILKKNDGEQTNTQEVVGKIAVGAIKYALLKSGIGKDIAFDFESSISFDGNSGPYVQYTYVRTHSVLRKGQRAKGKEHSGESNTVQDLGSTQLEHEELALLRLLLHFEEIVAEAGQRYAPSTLTTYLFALAQQFNLFYQKIPILKADEESQKRRLLITAAVGQTIFRGLKLLGIDAPEQM